MSEHQYSTDVWVEGGRGQGVFVRAGTVCGDLLIKLKCVSLVHHHSGFPRLIPGLPDIFDKSVRSTLCKMYGAVCYNILGDWIKSSKNWGKKAIHVVYLISHSQEIMCKSG